MDRRGLDYNGFRNWETWQILLWCDNDEFSYAARQRWMDRQTGEVTGDDCERFFRELFPNGTPDMVGAEDLVMVDWDEIAERINEEMEG